MEDQGRFIFSLPVWDDSEAALVHIRLFDGRYIAAWKCSCRVTDRIEAPTITDSIAGIKERYEAHCAAAHS